MTNYILGIGICGLIYGFYNKNFLLIGQKAGGQLNSDFDLGPRFLEDNKFSRKFLKDLMLPIKQKTIYVGYLEGKVIRNKYSKAFLRAYYKKSRGERKLTGQPVLNSGKTSLKVLTADLKQITETLSEILSDRIITDKISNINTNTGVLFGENVNYIFDKLVSTIPLYVFYNLSGRKEKAREYKAADITYVLLKKRFLNLKKYSFVYCVGNMPYHRLTKTKAGIVAELLGDHQEAELKAMFGEYFLNYKVLRNSQIIRGRALNKLNKNIVFAGRYGQNNRKIKTEQVIEQAIKYSQEVKKDGL